MESDLQQMVTNPSFENQKSTDADILHDYLKQMGFRTKSSRLNVRNTIASCYFN